jgi:hypothetical protein
MWKKLSAATAAIALASTLVVASVGNAEARHGRHAAFVGGLALGALALGALSAERDAGYDYDRDRCYPGPRRCHWVRGACYRDGWGHYDCEPGFRRCYRPIICE